MFLLSDLYQSKIVAVALILVVIVLVHAVDVNRDIRAMEESGLIDRKQRDSLLSPVFLIVLAAAALAVALLTPLNR